MRIVQIPVRLRVGEEPSAFLPPMVDTAERFPKIVQQDAVEEVFSPVSVPVDERHGTLAFGDLSRSVAAEADIPHPFHPCQQLRDFRSDQPRVKPLVEVHAVSSPHDLLYL